jgi:hypothetical protein
MTSYTIAFTPSDVAEASAVLTVHVNSSEPRVTEVSVRLGTSNRPLPDGLTTCDFRQILETVALLSRGQLPAPCLSAADEADPSGASAESRGGESSTPRSGPSPPPPEGPPMRSQQKPSPMDQVTMANKTSRGSALPAKAKNQREDTPSDLAVVYWREGTIAKVANHYSVPRHIAQRWIKLLRQGGTVPNPWPGQQSRSKPRSRPGIR